MDLKPAVCARGRGAFVGVGVSVWAVSVSGCLLDMGV